MQAKLSSISGQRRRIEELQQEIEDAETANDPSRSKPARAELEALIDQLAGATGLAGRDCKLGNPAERARPAFTWRIRSAIKKIRAAHHRLGQHFSNSIRTGTSALIPRQLRPLGSSEQAAPHIVSC